MHFVNAFIGKVLKMVKNTKKDCTKYFVYWHLKAQLHILALLTFLSDFAKFPGNTKNFRKTQYRLALLNNTNTHVFIFSFLIWAFICLFDHWNNLFCLLHPYKHNTQIIYKLIYLDMYVNIDRFQGNSLAKCLTDILPQYP